MTPRRIQRKRTKGWRMPEGAVYVGRPSRWGNPFRVGERITIPGIYVPDGSGTEVTTPITLGLSLVLYRARLLDGYLDPAPLRGRDLACWCPLDQPCHADVLLELANR